MSLSLLGCGGGSPAPQAQAQPAARGATIEHVLLISVDGLRPELLSPPFVGRLPSFSRLMAGPHTLDARPDPDITVTLPNHLSMLTGRPVLGEGGHGWTDNDDPPAAKHGGTIHARKGSYIPSMFDIAHDRGVATGVFATKTKFWLLEQSYSAAAGAVDTVEPDHGKAKIDMFVHARTSLGLAEHVSDHLRRARGATLDFVHFAAPDAAGHADGWTLEAGSRYVCAVEEVDRALGEILSAIDADADLSGRTAIVLTADHGGGAPAKTHTDRSAPINFRIPLLIWSGDRAASDLLAATPSRPRPAADTNPSVAEPAQPIRNGDAANICLSLLGLPPLPAPAYGGVDAVWAAR
ncbi:MAG: alkaline phosphatase [Planctomycetaceae bacterium]|nr:alkaline phosphatase [Planctomycetaceae bacterium]